MPIGIRNDRGLGLVGVVVYSRSIISSILEKVGGIDFLARVARFPPEDCRKGTHGSVLSLVVITSLVKVLDQVLLLLIVTTTGTANPHGISVTFEGFYERSDLRGAFRSVCILGNVTPSTLQVAPLTVHLGAVLKGVFDEGMIEDLGKERSPPIRISEPPMPFALTGYMPLIQQPASKL